MTVCAGDSGNCGDSADRQLTAVTVVAVVTARDSGGNGTVACRQWTVGRASGGSETVTVITIKLTKQSKIARKPK